MRGLEEVLRDTASQALQTGGAGAAVDAYNPLTPSQHAGSAGIGLDSLAAGGGRVGLSSALQQEEEVWQAQGLLKTLLPARKSVYGDALLAYVATEARCVKALAGRVGEFLPAFYCLSLSLSLLSFPELIDHNDHSPSSFVPPPSLTAMTVSKLHHLRQEEQTYAELGITGLVLDNNRAAIAEGEQDVAEDRQTLEDLRGSALEQLIGYAERVGGSAASSLASRAAALVPAAVKGSVSEIAAALAEAGVGATELQPFCGAVVAPVPAPVSASAPAASKPEPAPAPAAPASSEAGQKSSPPQKAVPAPAPSSVPVSASALAAAPPAAKAEASTSSSTPTREWKGWGK